MPRRRTSRSPTGRLPVWLGHTVCRRCPCGSTHLSACCGRYHAGPLPLAPTRRADALALQRLRAAPADYLLATWHPTTRPASCRPIPPVLRWLGLEVRSSRLDDPDHGRVEFVARCKLAGRAQRLHEISRFVRENGRWFYLDAE